MGHIGQKVLNKLSKAVTDVEYLRKDSQAEHICEICAEANLTSKIKKSSGDQASTYLESVSSDICGPISPTTSSKKAYFATFVDQATKWLEVRLLHTKDDVIQAIKDFITFEEKQSGQFVKRFHADNAREFIAGTLKDYYVQKGINSTYSAPYTPQQNGAAERINRTLINKVRAMLTQSKLPRKYWGEAVLAAGYLYNRTPHSAINFTTPFEAKFGKTPDLSNIYVWGSPVWKKLPNTTKLAPRAEKHYLIGYGSNQ